MARCCACSTNPSPEVCLTQITSADLAELLYVYGLDENLCPKYAAIADQFQFLDCAGTIIAPNTPLVTCEEFAEQLCATIADLATGGSVVLEVTQLVGADCLTYTIPETPITVIDTSTIDFTASGPYNHTITGVVRVSADVGNIIEIHSDGIYATVDGIVCEQIADFTVGAPVVFGVTQLVGDDCELHTVPPTVISVLDTPSVNMTITGAPGSQVISADVKISSASGNVTTINVDGVYTPGVCTQIAPLPSGVYVPGVTQLVGRDCNVYIIPASSGETPITVIDTTTVDLTATGILNHTLSAVVKVDPDITNIIQITSGGIFANVDITPVDTDCIDLTIVESPDGIFTIEANPILSSVPGNSLQCLPDGLYTTALSPGSFTFVRANDTNCLNLNAAFDGVDTYTITGEPTISPQANNDIVCTGTGLNVPGVNVSDTNCINMSVLLTGNQHVISAVPIISPTAGNQIVCSASGLYVPAASAALSVLDTNCINLTLAGNVLSADPILDSVHPGYAVAGSNSLVCDAGGLSAPPDIINLIDAQRYAPIGTIAMTPGIGIAQPVLTVTLTNTSPYRSALYEITLSHPSMSVGPFVANVDFIIGVTYLNVSSPGYSTGGYIVFDGTAFAGINITGGPYGMAIPGNSAILALNTAESTLAPGQSVTANMYFAYDNNGANTINTYIGASGIRVKVQSI